MAPFGGPAGYVQFVGADGEVLRPPGETSSLPVEQRAREIARAGSGRYFTDMDVDGTHLRVLTVGRSPDGALQVARPLDEVDDALDRIRLILALAIAGGIALAAALGTMVARSALAPIERFTSRTEELSTGLDLSERIDVEGKDELARLAHSFNTTLDALEEAVEAQRHLVADASHELRTPIASLRANIQVLEEADRLPADERERMRRDILEELDALTALVGDVVELARGTKPDQTQDDVRLDHVVEALVERARRREGDRVEFRLRLEPTVVRASPSASAGRSRTCSTTRASGARPAARSTSICSAGTLTVRDHGAGFAEAGPPPRVRALLPGADGARHVRVGPRPGDRPPGRRGPRRLG